MMFVDFKVSGPEALAKNGDKIFNYMTYVKKADASTVGVLKTTVGCVATIGDSAAHEVITWESADSFDSTT